MSCSGASAIAHINGIDMWASTSFRFHISDHDLTFSHCTCPTHIYITCIFSHPTGRTSGALPPGASWGVGRAYPCACYVVVAWGADAVNDVVTRELVPSSHPRPRLQLLHVESGVWAPTCSLWLRRSRIQTVISVYTHSAFQQQHESPLVSACFHFQHLSRRAAASEARSGSGGRGA